MIFGSVCSGIEAASVAWEPMGWKAAWYSEIDAFPSAVLAHRFPEVPNLGDMTTIQNRQEFTDGAIDLLVGGTPCQSFSVAGLRAGMDDPRGNLALIYLRLASIARPRWIVWENVPGVLSSNGGRDFGAFLGALGHLGYGWAYRILDAQHFGVPQRRRRVFVVGCLGDWRRAASVLFEPPGSGGNPASSSRTRSQVAQCLTAGIGKRYDPETETLIPTASWPAEVTATLDASYGKHQGQDHQHINNGASLFVPAPISFHATQVPVSGAVSPTLCASMQAGVVHQGVRRLTPRECERLQGFPDDWTLVPYRGRDAADGPRYKACGNSMAVPVMRWIGQRISQVEAIA